MVLDEEGRASADVIDGHVARGRADGELQPARREAHRRHLGRCAAGRLGSEALVGGDGAEQAALPGVPALHRAVGGAQGEHAVRGRDGDRVDARRARRERRHEAAALEVEAEAIGTWGATTRGTYGTAEAGTRTQYVQYVGPWGQAALRLR